MNRRFKLPLRCRGASPLLNQLAIRATRKVIISHAAQASAAAAASAAAPLPIGAALDALGFDLVKSIQDRLVVALCKRLGLDHATTRMQLERRFSTPGKQRRLMKSTRKLADSFVDQLVRTRLVPMIGKSAGRLVPLASASIVGTLAWRDTWRLGMSCLDLAAVSTNTIDR